MERDSSYEDSRSVRVAIRLRKKGVVWNPRKRSANGVEVPVTSKTRVDEDEDTLNQKQQVGWGVDSLDKECGDQVAMNLDLCLRSPSSSESGTGSGEEGNSEGAGEDLEDGAPIQDVQTRVFELDEGLAVEKEGIESDCGEISVEAKVFSGRRSKGRFFIKEFHKKWVREIPLSRNQITWMGQILLKRSNTFGENRAERITQSFGNGLASAWERENSWGVYLLFSFGRGMFLIFPSGIGGAEWLRVSVWISDCVKMDLESMVTPTSFEDSDSSSTEFLQPSHDNSQLLILDKKVAELNERLERVLEELRFFRHSVEDLCSSEDGIEREALAKPAMVDLDPRSSLRTDLGFQNMSDLSWEELDGYPKSSIGSFSRKCEGLPESFSGTSVWEDDADVAILSSSDSVAGSLIAAEESLSGVIGSGVVSFEFECSKSPALGLVKAPLDHNENIPKNPTLSLVHQNSDVEVDGGSGLESNWGKAMVTLETKEGYFLQEKGCTTGLMHPTVTWEEAFAMLCRGSSLEEVPLESLREESSVLPPEAEEESVSDTWTFFIEDNFEVFGGCLRPHWERCDRNEVIGALVDEGDPFTEDEGEEII